MKTHATARLRRWRLLGTILLSGVVAGCAHQTPMLCAPLQADGWSAQPVAVVCRFTPDANLDSAARTPVGDEGYYLHILTVSARWDYRDTASFLAQFAQRPWGHAWLVLESPENRLEYSRNGNFGQMKPRYHEGVIQRIRDGDPNPVAYLWKTMPDGRCEIGKADHTPSFVWQLPITRQQHQWIHDFVMHEKREHFGIRSDNCTDIVIAAGALAGINLVHRIRLTLPQELRYRGRMLRIWTDPQYRILEFGTPDVLEEDLRQLARFGIGRDATESYLGRAAMPGARMLDPVGRNHGSRPMADGPVDIWR